RNTKVNKLKIFVAENYDKIDKLVELMTADNLARGKGEQSLVPVRLPEIKKELEESGAPLSVSDLALDGSALIMEGIQPVKIGGVLDELWRECVINPSLNNTEWLLSRVRKYAETDSEE
ncbi:MAG: hypothetical protein ACLUSP_10550, partial [Christensenellales bacterium]